MTPTNTTGAQALSDDERFEAFFYGSFRDAGFTVGGHPVSSTNARHIWDAALSSREQAGAVADLGTARDLTVHRFGCPALRDAVGCTCAAPGAAVAAREQEEPPATLEAALYKISRLQDALAIATNAIEFRGLRIKELGAALASREEAPAASADAAQYSFVCNAGCGVCAVKVAPFEYERTETLEGEHLGSKYQPQIVSACCGSEVHVYDNRADQWGEQVIIAAPEQSAKGLTMGGEDAK
ncbi:hypothetical protein [Variovorax paradoxus]|uniref:Uncharacterized protein n=1 Tax=Variovorax paradoxus TaxID=34073 RepID=A0A679JFS6_VARPD|nr:hypothetical protein VVAX_04383 [Variovorax paradoxus]